MKDFEFYQDLDLRYPELAICIGQTKYRNIAKFFIPVLTPILNGDEPYDITDINISKSNILSDSSSMDITACTSSNYVELEIPDFISNYKVGDKFVIVFIGGDLNKPVIIGRLA